MLNHKNKHTNIKVVVDSTTYHLGQAVLKLKTKDNIRSLPKELVKSCAIAGLKVRGLIIFHEDGKITKKNNFNKDFKKLIEVQNTEYKNRMTGTIKEQVRHILLNHGPLSLEEIVEYSKNYPEHINKKQVGSAIGKLRKYGTNVINKDGKYYIEGHEPLQETQPTNEINISELNTLLNQMKTKIEEITSLINIIENKTVHNLI